MSQTVVSLQAWAARSKAARQTADRLAPARGMLVGVALGVSVYAVVAVGIWFAAGLG